MLLHDLLRSFESSINLGSLPNIEISSVQEDSRLVSAGALFIARSGTKTEGGRFVADAKARGAVAVVADKRIDGCPLPQVIVPDAARAASLLANRLVGQPSLALKVLGITGTNGKTTTAYLIRHILSHVKKRCGMIGTVEIDDGWQKHESTMTTPAATDVANLLASMRAAECHACAMETSSHSLTQSRIAGVHFAGAAFTNLTGDHLDYHGTMDQYAAAKANLFESLNSAAVAAVNIDDKWCSRMIRSCLARIVKFGFGPTADYRAVDIAITSQGSNFVLLTPDGRTEVQMQLIGRHNIENALAASALCGEVFGLSVHQIATALRDAPGAPGRLQTVRAGQPFAVLVDYAHTDDAMENVLTALRPLTRGRLRVLFGCGGDRDRTKRPRMAKIAQALADEIYVTSDNPRTENPQSILDEIISGFVADSSKAIHVEIDRRKAIEQILADAGTGDVVLLAGKGHENYQIIGTTKHHFDDVEEAMKALNSVSRASRPCL